MVKIHYCPKCKKASREHVFKKVRCKTCETNYDVIQISRSRYFVVQFIFLTLGFFFLIAAFVITDPRVRIYEFLGVSFMAIAMWIFTLYFQIMDSKDMEFRAEQRVMEDTLEDLDKPSLRTQLRASESSGSARDKDDDDLLAAKRRMARGRFGVNTRPQGGGRLDKEEDEPRVVRIRRAVPGTSNQSKAGVDEPKIKRKKEEPVIRDMSQLLEDVDEDEL